MKKTTLFIYWNHQDSHLFQSSISSVLFFVFVVFFETWRNTKPLKKILHFGEQQRDQLFRKKLFFFNKNIKLQASV